MDIRKILKELEEEKERIEQAILSLQRLTASGARRRGRPPKWRQEILEAQSRAGRPGKLSKSQGEQAE